MRALAGCALLLVAGCGSPSTDAEARTQPAAVAQIAYRDPSRPPPVVAIDPAWVEHRAKAAEPSHAYRWANIVLEAAGRDVDKVGARPTIISRQMAIAFTAMYDAWAAYDDRAVGTRLGASLRRPPAERTQANKTSAISYATYRALLEVFPDDARWLAEQMRALGHDPADASTDPTTPAGIGNRAAAALLAYRRHDGSNAHGDEVGGNGQPYADYTYYETKNPIGVPMRDPDRWQPIGFQTPKGLVYPGFLTPHWYRVAPLGLARADQFRPPPQPKVGSAELQRDVEEVIAMNGGLSLEDKSIVEFMRDGPRSTGQSGHWIEFAQDVARRDRHDLDRDVKLFFAVSNAAFDAFIAAWDSKRVHDSARPYALVRTLFAGKKIMGYLGPGKGFGPIAAEDWIPYSPPTFPTPPFPGYASGHSTVSAACSKVLELFTGSDRFGSYHHHTAGMYTEADADVAAMQSRGTRPALTSKRVTLTMPTFTATAEMAGISRVMGGYHIQSDNTAGLALGRKVANHAWLEYRSYFEGTRPSSARDVDAVARPGR